MRELVDEQGKRARAIKERNRLPTYSLWYVKFFALEQGETRFSPQEFIISNTGRDFRPIDVLPLSAGFGEYRLRQREVQSALFVFDGQIDLNQPTKAIMEGTASVTDWGRVLQVIERERALVRSRASAAPRNPRRRTPPSRSGRAAVAQGTSSTSSTAPGIARAQQVHRVAHGLHARAATPAAAMAATGERHAEASCSMPERHRRRRPARRQRTRSPSARVDPCGR